MESTSASEPSFTRPRYFHGQLLGVDEFAAEQDYHIGKRRLHHRVLHGVGVVAGLEVEAGTGPQVLVQPGVAIDPAGREIVVPEAQSVDLGAWLHPKQEDSPPSLALCLEYREEAVEPSGTEAEEPSRVSETFALTVEEGEPPDGCLLVATVAVDGEGLRIDVPTEPPRLPSVAELVELVETLGRRVEELERTVRSR